MNIAQSTIKITAARASSLVLTFAGTAFFAQELGATLLGVFFLFQAVLSISQLPANLGIRIAVEKRISEGGPTHQILGTGIVLKSVLVVTTVIIIVTFRTYINQYIGVKAAYLLVIAIILQESAGLMMNVLKGELRTGETATLHFIYTIIWVTLGMGLVVLEFGVFALIYSVIIGRVVQLLCAIYKISIGVGKASMTQARSIFGYAKYSIIPEIDSQVHGWMDILIIGFIITQASVGAYEVAWRVASPVLLLTGAIGTTIFPQISSWSADDTVEPLEKLLQKIIVPSVVFVFPAFFGGALLASDILRLVFGDEFTTAWLALIILLAGKLPHAIRQIAGKSLLGLDRPDLVTHAAIVDIAANLLLNLILIWQFGIIGAALGTTLSMTLGTIHRTYYLSKFVNIQVPYDRLGWCIFSSVGMYVILYVIKRTVGVSSVLHLFAFVFAGAVIYSGLILLYRPLRMEVLNMKQLFSS